LQARGFVGQKAAGEGAISTILEDAAQFLEFVGLFPVAPISPFPFRGSTEPCRSLLPSKIRMSFDQTRRNSLMRSASSHQGHDQR
jgi:hypothetical protein